jgi:hypothetical protein
MRDERWPEGSGLRAEPIGRYVAMDGTTVIRKWITTETAALSYFYKIAGSTAVLVGPRGTTVRRMVSLISSV